MHLTPCSRIARQRLLALALPVTLALSLAQSARAADGTWNTDASGSWTSGVGTNWLNGTVAEGADFTANFSTLNIASNRTVTLTAPLTIGNMSFADTSGTQTWTLAQSGNSVLTLQTSSGTPTVTVGNTTTISGILGGNQGFTKAGSGKLVLTGNNATTGGFTGGISVSAGTLDVQNTNSVGTSSIALASGTTLDSGSSLSTIVTIGGDISGAGRINKTSSASTLVLTGNNTHSGGTTLTDGRLSLGSGTNNGLGTGTFAINGGAVQSSDNTSRTIGNTLSTGSNSVSFGATQGNSTGLGDLTFTSTASTALGGSKTWTVTNSTTVSFANAWSGSNTVTKAGTGTLLFNNAASSYSGATRINGGVLGITSLANGGSNSGIGSAGTAATNLILAGGSLRFTGDTSGSTNRLFSLAYGANGASSVLDSSGSVPMQFTGTGDIGVANGSASTPFTGSIPVGTTTFTLSDISNVAVGMGVTGSIVPAGTYVTAINTGTKQVTLSQASTSAVTNGTASFALYGGPRVLTLTGTNTGANVLAANLTDASPSNGSQSGLLSHAASLIKDGVGAWSITGTNTYTGPTTINAGTLFVDGAITGAGAVAVNGTGTLAGSGSIAGAASAASGSFLSPGSGSGAVGTLTFTSTLDVSGLASGTGGLLFNLDAAGASDKIASGALTIGSGLLDLDDFGFTTLGSFGAGVYTLFDATSIIGTLGSNLTGTLGGYNTALSIDALNNDLILTVSSAIPEPSTFATLAGGLALASAACVRRRRKA